MQFDEINLIKKKWKKGMLKIALVYPNKYSAMSGLTIQTLYNLWNSRENVVCERFFLPDSAKSAGLSGDTFRKGYNLRKKGHYTDELMMGNTRVEIPVSRIMEPLRSLESGMPLVGFDIVAFTISFELDYPNVPFILKNAGIDPLRKIRMKDRNDGVENRPIIIAGGPAIRANPLPLADFIDAFFIGELEAQNDRFIDLWMETHSAEEDPNVSGEIDEDLVFLKGLAEIPGFWMPEFDGHSREISRQFVKDLDLIAHPIHQIIPADEDEGRDLPFGRSLYIEVNRGCPYSCAFCITGNQLKPFRNRSYENLIDIIEKGLEATGVEKVVFIGSAISDHPRFTDLCRYLVNKGVEYSIPSIRIDRITEELAELLSKSGMRTIAIAPETGDDKFRKEVLKKYIRNEQILNGCTILYDAGLPQIKLYMIYGFPQETDDVARSISTLTKDVAEIGYGKRAVRLSLNPFIPKAHTPLQWGVEPYLDYKMTLLKRRFELITKPLKSDIRIRIKTMPLEEAYIQTVFSLGTEEIGELIYYLSEQPVFLPKSIRNWYKVCRKEYWREKINDNFRMISDIHKRDDRNYPWRFIRQRPDLDGLKRKN